MRETDMNADPFRPLPSRDDYKADLARLGGHEEPEWLPGEARQGSSVGVVIIGAAATALAVAVLAGKAMF